MKTLREALQNYLALRRGLGFKMRDAGKVLLRFVTFVEEREALHIKTRRALEWVQQAKTVQPARMGTTTLLYTVDPVSCPSIHPSEPYWRLSVSALLCRRWRDRIRRCAHYSYFQHAILARIDGCIMTKSTVTLDRDRCVPDSPCAIAEAVNFVGRACESGIRRFEKGLEVLF
jgi:hypothetical protein